MKIPLNVLSLSRAWTWISLFMLLMWCVPERITHIYTHCKVVGRATLTWEGGRDSLILEHSKPWRAWETAIRERNRGTVGKADLRISTHLHLLIRMLDSYYSAKGKRTLCLWDRSSNAARERGSEVVKSSDTTGARHQVLFQCVDSRGCAWVCVCQREQEEKGNLWAV